jgi:epoxyqueuosine reductase
MTSAQYVATYAGTAVTRARRRGLARNAAVALGNSGDPRAEPILLRMLNDHDEALARAHAVWGLSVLDGGTYLRKILDRRYCLDADEYVRDEIRTALAGS